HRRRHHTVVGHPAVGLEEGEVFRFMVVPLVHRTHNVSNQSAQHGKALLSMVTTELFPSYHRAGWFSSPWWRKDGTAYPWGGRGSSRPWGAAPRCPACPAGVPISPEKWGERGPGLRPWTPGIMAARSHSLIFGIVVFGTI